MILSQGVVQFGKLLKGWLQTKRAENHYSVVWIRPTVVATFLLIRGVARQAHTQGSQWRTGQIWLPLCWLWQCGQPPLWWWLFLRHPHKGGTQCCCPVPPPPVIWLLFMFLSHHYELKSSAWLHTNRASYLSLPEWVDKRRGNQERVRSSAFLFQVSHYTSYIDFSPSPFQQQYYTLLPSKQCSDVGKKQAIQCLYSTPIKFTALEPQRDLPSHKGNL